MNSFQLKSQMMSSPEKNFDINLKVNFQSGHVSLGIPRNFKKKQATQTIYGNYAPVRQIYSKPISQSIQQPFYLNLQKQSVAQTINVVDCVICGKAYAENEFSQHLQFHRQRKGKFQSHSEQKLISQHEKTSRTELRSSSQYTFQPVRQRIGNSISGSIPEVYETNSGVHYGKLDYSNSQQSDGFSFNDNRNVNSNINGKVYYYSDHVSQNSNLRNSVCSLNINGQSVNNFQLIRPINHQSRTYSVPDPREFQRIQQFYPSQMRRVSYTQSASNQFCQGLQPNQVPIKTNAIYYENQQRKSLPVQNLNDRNRGGGIRRIAAIKNNMKAQSNNSSENYDNRIPISSDLHIRNNASLSAQTSPKRSKLESQISQTIKFSQANQVRSRMIPQNSVNLKKTDKLQNSLYHSFKNQEGQESSDQEGGFKLDKDKPKLILQRVSSNDFKSVKIERESGLGSSSVCHSQNSEKSKSSKTKIPINYLAREEFIQSSLANSSCT